MGCGRGCRCRYGRQGGRFRGGAARGQRLDDRAAVSGHIAGDGGVWRQFVGGEKRTQRHNDAVVAFQRAFGAVAGNRASPAVDLVADGSQAAGGADGAYCGDGSQGADDDAFLFQFEVVARHYPHIFPAAAHKHFYRFAAVFPEGQGTIKGNFPAADNRSFVAEIAGGGGEVFGIGEAQLFALNAQRAGQGFSQCRDDSVISGGQGGKVRYFRIQADGNARVFNQAGNFCFQNRTGKAAFGD